MQSFTYKGLELNKYAINNSTQFDNVYYSNRDKVGQLKLLVNEIAFIEYLKCKGQKYSPFQVCGGAPGIHYELLSRMYPDIEFVLYDKMPFYAGLHKCANIKLHNTYVTASIARTEFDKTGVFVSDMRSLDMAEKKRELSEKGKSDIYNYTIAKDMYDQLVFF